MSQKINMTKHRITILFLLAAIVFYVLGFALHGTILIVLGALAELVFWVRAIMEIRNDRKNKSKESQ